LIDGCDLVFLAKSKDGDYHQEMSGLKIHWCLLWKILDWLC
jgi:hypothetical protein